MLGNVLFENRAIIPGARATKSALTSGRVIMDMIAQNIANQYTTRDVDGKPYKARIVTLATQTIEKNTGNALRAVKVVSVTKDQRPGPKEYNPEHPHADKNGILEHSNVNMAQQMVDMIKYTRWLEAQYAVSNASIKMVQNAIHLGQ